MDSFYLLKGVYEGSCISGPLFNLYMLELAPDVFTLFTCILIVNNYIMLI